MSYRKKTKKTYIKYNSKNKTVKNNKSIGGNVISFLDNFKIFNKFKNIYNSLNKRSYEQIKGDTQFKYFKENLLDEDFLSNNSTLLSIREKVKKIKGKTINNKKDKENSEKIYQIYNYLWYKFITFPFIFSINSNKKELNELELKLLKIKKKINTINQKNLKHELIDYFNVLKNKIEHILPIINNKWNKPIPPNYIMKIKKGSNDTTYAQVKIIPTDTVELEDLIESDNLDWSIDKPDYKSSESFEYQLIYVNYTKQLFYYKCIKK